MGELFHDRLHQPTHFVLRQPFCQRINGKHPSTITDVVVAKPLNSRMRKFPTPKIETWLARKEHALTNLKSLQDKRLIEEDAPDEASIGLDEDRRHHPSFCRFLCVSIDDDPADRSQLALFQIEDA